MGRPCLIVSLLALACLVAPAPALAAAPAGVEPPAITGSAREGQVLTSSTGTWTGTDPIAYKRGWQRCDRDGVNCFALAATGETYTPVAQDVGNTLRVKVEARNAEGVAYATSDATAVVSGNPPNNTGAPVVSGNLRSGQTLSTTNGTWTGTNPLAFSFTWRRCDAEGAACVSIPKANASTYRLTDDDIGARIRVLVTATNTVGSGEGNSSATAAIGPAEPPVAVTAPTISGTARDGQPLKIAYGEWTGAAVISFKQTWWRCDAFGAGCSPISGAAAQTYTLSPADVGYRIQAIVSATNPDGSTTVTTTQTAVVAINPPANTSPPSVSGGTRVGQVLTAKVGSWTGTPTLAFAYQWLRCDANGAGCLPIDGATEEAYRLTDADLDLKLAVRVTAGNPGGTATRDSTASPLVTPAQPPVNTLEPAATGTPRDGETLSSTTGTWTGIATISYTRQWLRCDSAGDACAAIPGATASTYKLTADDTGRTVRVQVRATNPDGTQTARSAARAVAPAPPLATRAPVQSGLAVDGRTLTTTTGTWTGTPAIAYAYSWERCDATAGSCAPIAGATATTYKLTAADIGSRLRARVTATNLAATVSAVTGVTVTVEAAPPVATVLPTVAGTARDREILVGDDGSWAGTEPISYERRWRRCSPTGAQCQTIPGAEGPTYALTPADVGSSIRLRLEATNRRATTAQESTPTAVVQSAKPVSTVAPVLTGAARDGETLTTSTGSWTGTPTLSFLYQWEHCPLPDACQPILGATKPSYTLTRADLATAVRVRVTAVNAGGSAVAYSGSTEPVGTVAPASTGLPAITGTARDSQLLTATPGDWSGTLPQARRYTWLRCDAQGAACAAVDGATAPAYGLTPEDVGATLRVRVSSANVAGTAAATSERTPLVAPDPPVSTVIPVITGEPRDGRTLTADTGAWTGTPTLRFAYRWQRCPTSEESSKCTDIDGAAGRSYVLRTADFDHRIRLVVTAANEGGASSRTTEPTGVVQPNPPVNVTPPSIVGIVRDGEELTARQGSWSGVLTFAYEYRWYRCDESGENCGKVEGATLPTFLMTGLDVGGTVRVEVIARNGGGATAAMSAATSVGAPSPPAGRSAPSITGYTGLGQEMTAVDGGWAGSPTLTFTRQWLRCDAAGAACQPVPGATGRVYRLVAADLGRRMRIRVEATNAVGAARADSEPTRLVRDDPPVPVEVPTVTTPTVFAEAVRVSATDGRWSGGGPFEISYRWRRCNDAGDACADIAGATERTYLPTREDVGRTLRVMVTMDNGVGAASATSAATRPLKVAPPENLTAPLLEAATGLLPGTELLATQGTWAGAEPIAYAYSWLRCAADGGGCEIIPGVGGPKYVLADADLGRSVRVRVTATNTTLTVSADSQPLGPVVPVAPINTGKPIVVIDGAPGQTQARVGMQLRGEGGSWKGTGPLRFVYRWQRCVSATDCQDIAGADRPTYILTEADVARRLRLSVVAENVGGGASAVSATTNAIAGSLPTAITSPRALVVSGDLREGARLVAEPGEWAGTGVIGFAYQWQRCRDEGNCKPIPRATRPDYTATGSDIGIRLAVLVTGKSAAGRGDAQSPLTGAVGAVAPTNGKPPVINRPASHLQAGLRLTSEAGEWLGSKPLALSYQWLRCTETGKRCRAIKDATDPDYVVREDDVASGVLGGSLRVAVTARNPAGSATATSQQFNDGDVVPGSKSKSKSKSKSRSTKTRTRVRRPAVSARFDSRGRLAVRVRCPKGRAACTGQVALAAAGLKRALPFNVRPGTARRWAIALPARQKKAAGRAKVLRGR
ncbi:MAG: hypothetical protein M3P50_14100, partial [Actinomycetota bacterium]|nr:hypothetical protein [Actinomycetota bacterium]